MSTKIYRGFIVDTNNMHLLMEKVLHFRPWVEDQAMEKLRKFIADLKEDGKDKSQACRAWNKLRRENRAGGHRSSTTDTDFQLVFMPYEDKCLGIGYTSDDEWFKGWLKQPGVSYFGYWNNSDGPEDVPLEEWEKRGKMWDEVLTKGNYIPSNAGFTIDLMDPMGPPTWKA